MAVFKCKMCGGDLNVTSDEKITECEYCGTTQTVPNADDEKKTNLFNRANRLRMESEFDKAAGVYESIVAEFSEEAEGYWGLCLCAYGIEYVDDAKTGKKIPTCHRTLPSSIMDDENFEKASEYSDMASRRIYREEAKKIDELQKKIISVVESEEPYDIFICYKETDEVSRQRTEDSAIAQDIYTELIKEGYKVFFSRVTLRDKAGTEYEPYIYAALKSAKIMLAIGTKYEYYDAVWVKNEWSRYISMMADDSSKHLIPCFKNLDAYDIPKEFKNLQALDMGEITFFKSLMVNVERFVKNNKAVEMSVNNKTVEMPTTKMAEPEPNVEEAYEEDFYEENPNLDFEEIYQEAEKTMAKAEDEVDYRNAAEMFERIRGYEDSEDKAKECRELEKEVIYQKASSGDYMTAVSAKMFESIKGYKDAEEKAEEFRKKAEEERIEDEINRKKIIAGLKIVGPIVAAILAIILILTVVSSATGYNLALINENWEEAVERGEHEAFFEEIKSELRNSGLCQHCGGAFKGLITKTCVSCGKKKDY